MNYEDPMQRKRRRLILLSAAAVLLGVFVAAFLAVQNRQPVHTVSIRDIGQCSPRINGSVTAGLESDLYRYVKAGNDYNHLSTLPKYSAKLRAGSCTQKGSHTSIGVNGQDQAVKISSAIVDIPDAKQSWRITYNWIPRGESINTDLGTPQVECLPEKDLVYGTFQCDKLLSKLRYGTDKYDPILPYMPYSGAGFDLEYNPDTRQVTAIIYIPAKQRDNQVLLNNSKAIVPYWFEHRGLDINSYAVVYNIQYQ